MIELDTPLKLMRNALALLDDAGEQAAACYLQRAIDAVDRIPPMQPGDMIDSELINRMVIHRGDTPANDLTGFRSYAQDPLV